jgi:hypothetical protein
VLVQSFGANVGGRTSRPSLFSPRTPEPNVTTVDSNGKKEGNELAISPRPGIPRVDFVHRGCPALLKSEIKHQSASRANVLSEAVSRFANFHQSRWQRDALMQSSSARYLRANDQNRTQALRRHLGLAGVQSRGFRSLYGLASPKFELASIGDRDTRCPDRDTVCEAVWWWVREVEALGLSSSSLDAASS